jgi:quercetin dioxygenase-like cupin family protein
MTTATIAQAGECPADQVGVDVMPAGPGAPEGVTDTVLGSIDLASQVEGVQDRLLRSRLLVIQPGGIVPWHSHDDRPALIYVIEGQVTEYRSTCKVPIVHNAGEISVESKGISHWWKNTGSVPARLISSDVFHDADAMGM